MVKKCFDLVTGKLVQTHIESGSLVEIDDETYDRMLDYYDDYNKALLTLKNIHKGQTIHVVGTGPSVAKVNVDWSLLITIGVNGAFKIVPDLNYWLMVDNWSPNNKNPLYKEVNKWFTGDEETIKLCRYGIFGPYSMMDDDEKKPDHMFRHSGFGPVSSLSGGLFWGRSSVSAAVDLARHMGASKVVLWGCDFNDHSHAYDMVHGAQWDLGKLEKEFTILRKGCADYNCEIVNASPGSALKAIPCVDPGEVGVTLRSAAESDMCITYDLENEEIIIFGNTFTREQIKNNDEWKFLLTVWKRMEKISLL